MLSITRKDWSLKLNQNSEAVIQGSTFHHISDKNHENEIKNSPILCLHGLGACRRVWDEISISLAAQGFIVASFDMRNHGDSSNVDNIQNDLSMQVLMDDITRVLFYLQDNDKNNESNWLENCTIIGHSYSGNIALYYALQQHHHHHHHKNHIIKKDEQIKLKRTICIDGGYINLQRTFTAGWQECFCTMVPKEDFMNEILWAQLPVALQQMFPNYSSLAINATMGSFQQFEKKNNQNEDIFLKNVNAANQQHVMLRLDHDAHIMFLRQLWDFTPHNVSKKYLDSEKEAAKGMANITTTTTFTAATTSEAITTTTIEENGEDSDHYCTIHILPTKDETSFSRDKQKDVSSAVNALTATALPGSHDNHEQEHDKEDEGKNKRKIRVHVQWLDSNHHVPLAAPSALHNVLTEIMMHS